MTLRRLVAALIALGVALTLATRIHIRMSEDGETLAEALWGMYRFYTIWMNTLIGIACASIAIGRPISPKLLSNLLLSILIVAVVYHALLAGLNTFVGRDALIDAMLHSVIPVSFAAFWLLFVPKEDLDARGILSWLVLPFVYCVYAMTRAQFDGVYPYFFLDLETLGPARTALNILGLLIGFAIIGGLIVLCGRIIASATARLKRRKESA